MIEPIRPAGPVLSNIPTHVSILGGDPSQMNDTFAYDGGFIMHLLVFVTGDVLLLGAGSPGHSEGSSAQIGPRARTAWN